MEVCAQLQVSTSSMVTSRKSQQARESLPVDKQMIRALLCSSKRINEGGEGSEDLLLSE